jgi:hypothetical protein
MSWADWTTWRLPGIDGVGMTGAGADCGVEVAAEPDAAEDAADAAEDAADFSPPNAGACGAERLVGRPVSMGLGVRLWFAAPADADADAEVAVALPALLLAALLAVKLLV